MCKSEPLRSSEYVWRVEYGTALYTQSLNDIYSIGVIVTAHTGMSQVRARYRKPALKQ